MTILLILVPLLWILRFKDYKFGFVSVVSGVVFLNAFISVFLQTLGIFKFPQLLVAYILVACITIFFNYKPLFEKVKSFKNFNYKLIPWAILSALVVISMQFYFVHYKYTGEIVTYDGISKVENFNSGQPYFSDEWVTVGMSEKSIETGKLPFINFLDGTKFTNLLFLFQSSISGIDLFLNLNLLMDYKAVSILFSLILLSFIYVLLRNFKISIGVSIFVLFLISYLPNSANLPLLWYLLPWNVGLIFLISYFIAVQKQYFKTALVFNVISIAFYPPIVLLAIPSFLTLFFEIKEKREKIKVFSIYFGLMFLGLILSAGLLQMILDFVFRPLNSALGQAPLFIIWEVVPWFAVPFVFLGLWNIRREFKFVSITIFIGLIMWFLYGSKMETFIMDYHRIVAVTSILLLVASSFAFEKLHSRIRLEKIKKSLPVLIAIIFFALCFNFTEREGWKNFTTLNFSPAPPANKYLIDDDINLFSGFRNEKFLAPPWKGLTLAVATKNYPVVSKPSTLTMNLMRYEDFLQADCVNKKALTNKFKIKYVYTPEFKCDGFEFVGKSTEGLALYLVK